MEWTTRPLCTFGIAAGLTLVPISGMPDTLDQPFLITTTSQTAGTTTTYSDVLVVHGDATASILSSPANTPARIERDRSCYAVIGHILGAGVPARPYAIGVMLDDAHVVPVAMSVTGAEPASGAQLIEAAGDGGAQLIDGATRVTIGVHVDAHVLAQNGQLEAATFRQTTYLNTPAETVGVSGCALQRLPAAPLGNATPLAPT